MAFQNHVLHVITSINRGGAENHLLELVSQQIKSNIKVGVAYLQGNGYWHDRLVSMGAEVTNLHLPLRRYGDPAPIFRLRALLRSKRPSLVHAHMPPAELYTRLALLGISRRRMPLIITKHNDERFYRGAGQRTVARWVAARADKVIAISDAVRRYSCGSGIGLPETKVVTVHYGINTADYEHVNRESVNDLRNQWGVGKGEYCIGCVARLEPQKAIAVLVEGFALYLAQNPGGAKLVIIGAGSLEKELKTQSSRSKIADKVVWAGFREDIPLVMNSIDVLALTSIWEGFGLVLIEAMAAGKPVIASRISAIPEIVADGETGVLVPARQPGAVAEAIKLLEDPDVRQEYGKAARDRVKKAFTIDRMVKQTSLIYEESLQKCRIRES
jgi:glycosyltransferase involved in cell wall biosynthesis